MRAFLYTYVPRAPLADFVESFWFYENDTPLWRPTLAFALAWQA
jgi:hypothetical protein